MEDLTKQQLILLALFVSFVTSIATGIVTVSLIGESQLSVVQSINKVVERTVERVVEDPNGTKITTASAVTSQDIPFSKVIEKVSEGLVRIKPKGIGPDGVEGYGIILSGTGLVLADKQTLGMKEGVSVQDYVAILSTGEEFPLKAVQSEILGDIAFAALIVPAYRELTPVTWATPETSMKLGDAVYVLTGKTNSALESGILKKVPTETNENVETSITSKDIVTGAPLFNDKGIVIGFKTTSLKETSSFYPLSTLRAIAPQISR